MDAKTYPLERTKSCYLLWESMKFSSTRVVDQSED